MHRSHLAQLVAINAIWGFNIVAVKLSADRFPPVFLTFLRFLIVGLAVWPWLRPRRGEDGIPDPRGPVTGVPAVSGGPARG